VFYLFKVSGYKNIPDPPEADQFKQHMKYPKYISAAERGRCKLVSNKRIMSAQVVIGLGAQSARIVKSGTTKI
jgi:hypothetical protein